MDSRISALITAGKKAFLPLTQKSRGGAQPKEMKHFGTQTHCLLDLFKPYQRLELSRSHWLRAQSGMMMFKFHVQVKTEGAVAIGFSALILPVKPLLVFVIIGADGRGSVKGTSPHNQSD